MNILLSEHFTISKLLRFAIPTIIMMILTSIYNVVDGIFISKYVGSQAFAAVHFVTPIVMLIGCIGFMFGSGGNALVAKLLGEKKPRQANQVFSMLVYVLFGLGACLTLLGIVLLPSMIDFFGVSQEFSFQALTYGYLVLLATVPLIFQFFFHPFMITAERPQFGLLITLIAGGTNVLLDALFVVCFRWGLEGAAYATIISEIFGGFIPLLFFYLPNKTRLHIGKTKWDGHALLQTIGNGMSEFVNHISISFVFMLYIYQMLKYAGEEGVAAFGVITSMNFLFISVFVGYALGTGSIVSYHYGAQNDRELKSLLKNNIKILFCMSVGLMGLSELLASFITGLFIAPDNLSLFNFARYGFRIYVISYLFSAYTIYASGFFTALNNGMISAIISLSRTFIFQSLAILILPLLFGVNGIFFSVVVSELIALTLSIFFIWHYRKRYKYI